MRLHTITFLLLLTSLSFFSQAASKKGLWFVHGSALTGAYQYEEDDARNALPDAIEQMLDSQTLTGDDSDYLNISLGAGYYLNDDMNVSITFTEGIELNFLGSFNFSFNNTNLNRSRLNADLQMLELDLSYKAFQLSPSLALTIKGGLVLNKLETNIVEVTDMVISSSTDDTQTKVGAKAGVGLQWDFADNWALKGGYSHLSFLSMDKIYMQLEYRF